MAAKPAIEKERKLLQLTPVGSYKRMVGKLIISISGYSNFSPLPCFQTVENEGGWKGYRRANYNGITPKWSKTKREKRFKGGGKVRIAADNLW